MLNNFFKIVENTKHKHQFIHKLIHSNALKAFVAFYESIKVYLYKRPNAQKFFSQNVSRVANITNALADEKSKTIYNSLINFRQSRRKKDFPVEHYDKIQYFINEMKLNPNEVFIDCGAFDGDTIEAFLSYCPEYKQIVAFEPDTTNFRKLQAKHHANPKAMLINAGAWESDGTVSFSGSDVSGMIIAGGGDLSETSRTPRGDLSGASRIERGDLSGASRIERGSPIPVKSIDGLGLDGVTFIKMDIEGAEMKALAGAKNTILRDKPKLAICIYHSDEDMIDIPEYIHELVPEYKLYVRHHKQYPCLFETVVYATL